MFYVVIPTYNRAHTLLRALKSVILQKNTHVLIIDDGSTDNTEKLIQEYGDIYPQFKSKFTYFYKENWWVSDACNFWIEKALEISENYHDDFITRLGSDDEFFLNAFEKIERAVEAFPDNNLFYFKMVDEGVRDRTHMSNSLIQLNYKEYLSGRQLFWDDANDVIRLSVLKEKYFRFEKDLWGGDSILFHKIIRKYNSIVAFNIETYLVHTDTYSMTRSLMDKKFCLRLFLVQERILHIFGDDYRCLNPKLLWLHYLVISRFSWLLWKKGLALRYLLKGIYYRVTDWKRIILAVLWLFPGSIHIINAIIRIFVLPIHVPDYMKLQIPISCPIIEKEEIEAVLRVMKSGNLVQWNEVSKIERSFSELTGRQFAVAFNSGTAAIHAWLYAMNIHENDEVITTPFTFVASANPILMQNAKVVFADILEDVYLINVDEVAKKITKNTKAVIPVSLYGQVYDYERMQVLARKHWFAILEDACQSVGAERNTIPSWSCWDIGTFSLYATKNIMCGEGGMLVTDKKEFADRARAFRQHGMQESWSYEYTDLWYNYRMTDILAAIANVQFEKLRTFTEKRRHNAALLTRMLQGIPWIILPKVNEGNYHVFHQYTIRITEEFPLTREDLVAKLHIDWIWNKVYYPIPLHLYPHFSKFGYKQWDFPVAEKIAKQVISLPIHPSITDNNLEYISSRIKFYSQN